LLGQQVAPLHAVLEFRPETAHWVLIDLGSDQGTWIEKEPIVSCAIDKPVLVRVGGHELHLHPSYIDNELFNKRANSQSEGNTYHQVIVRNKHVVLETKLLGANEAFEFKIQDTVKRYSPPLDYKWIVDEFSENLFVQQRLVKQNQINN